MVAMSAFQKYATGADLCNLRRGVREFPSSPMPNHEKALPLLWNSKISGIKDEWVND
jgi:hypothetical protein